MPGFIYGLSNTARQIYHAEVSGSRQSLPEPITIIECPSLVFEGHEVKLNRAFSIKDLPDGYHIRYQGQLVANIPSASGYFDTVPMPRTPATPLSTNKAQYWLDRSGCNTCHQRSSNEIGPSYEAIAI